eukprot:TRINITY_DN12552_c0_g2_i1.p1 TRINITY_DN12552_c0_g2~~TRINITY_DN12552_c0_g2_i1.p1  ORF type:complete len:388 (+),score=79.61 TRINITY_DN12552_c0_g2_i1:215-1378(+)
MGSSASRQTTPPAYQRGVIFPSSSTTTTAKAVWAAAALSVDQALADSIHADPNWRANYADHVLALASQQAASPEAAMAVAESGLQEVYRAFRFARGERDYSLEEAMLLPAEVEFRTKTIQGSGTPGTEQGLMDPATADAWASYGCCEQTVPASLRWVEQLRGEGHLQSLLDSHAFVLLGATSELGPVLPLLDLGATVVAVARPGTKLQGLMTKAKCMAGTLVVPMSPSSEPQDPEQVDSILGCDLITQMPEAVAWLKDVLPERTLVVQHLVYLDGAAHVQASVAMDAIATNVASCRRVAYAYLGSPAMPYPISSEAHADARQRYQNSSLLYTPFRLKSNALGETPAIGPHGEEYTAYLTDGILNFQGPNYALAKTCLLYTSPSPRDS